MDGGSDDRLRFIELAPWKLMTGKFAGHVERIALPQLFRAVAASTLGAGLLLALLRPIRRLRGGRHGAGREV
jgi:hydrogenase/urease accessory protein HupE